MDKLQGVGFRVNNGMKGAGLVLQNKVKGGGHFLGMSNYRERLRANCGALDTGASQLIIDGTIKLKNDAQIKKFDKDGLVFDNGTKLTADTIICATGYVVRLALSGCSLIC